MKNVKGILTLTVAAGLGVGYQANAKSVSIPTVNISDTAGPITVTSSGFTSFSSGFISGNPEAIWWTATGKNLGTGIASGIWTEPGSSTISDEFLVVTLGTSAYGIFLSDPALLPTSFTIPGGGTIDLTKYNFSSSVETGQPTQISPTSSLLSVMATSSVPDGGSTIILLGLGMGGLVWFGKRRGRSTNS